LTRVPSGYTGESSCAVTVIRRSIMPRKRTLTSMRLA
jgi:hypothetical protein